MNVYFEVPYIPLPSPVPPLFIRFHTFPSLPPNRVSFLHHCAFKIIPRSIYFNRANKIQKYFSSYVLAQKSFFFWLLLGKDNHVPFHLLTLLSTFLPFRSFCHFFSSPSSCYSLNSPTKNDILNISRTTILEGKKHNFYL